jgi:hypothetical protein
LPVRRTDSGKVRFHNNAVIVVILVLGGDVIAHGCARAERRRPLLSHVAERPFKVTQRTQLLRF